MKTHVFSNVKLSISKSTLELSSVPLLWKCARCFLLLAEAGPAADLEDLSRFWIPQSSIRPNFRIGPWLLQNHFIYFFDHQSLLYTRETYVFCILFIFLMHCPPFFSASGIPLRGSILDFAHCSRASICADYMVLAQDRDKNAPAHVKLMFSKRIMFFGSWHFLVMLSLWK